MAGGGGREAGGGGREGGKAGRRESGKAESGKAEKRKVRASLDVEWNLERIAGLD